MRTCIECGTLINRGSRCQQHRVRPPTDQQRSWSEIQRRKAAVTAWVAEHGHWCPGWEVPSHPAADLTADHVLAVAHGGGNGPLQVLCRPCNSRKGARTVEQVSEQTPPVFE